jgi:two-component system, chemotaxis family, CheB/CheR fusion protein
MARKKRSSARTPSSGAKPAVPEVPAAITGGDGLDSHPALPFAVVAVGASAGGLPAISELLRTLPADTGMAFVIVQHLEPSHTSLMRDILARDTKMEVREITDGLRLQPNHIYVIPPAKSLVMEGAVLRLGPRTEARALHRPIDHFMRSLAKSQSGKAIGVILSGTATDGTLGLQEIKAAGGITFAQDGTAEHSGMPRSAIAAGCVDFVLPPDEIAREIASISRHPYVTPGEAPEPAGAADAAAMARVLELLRHSSGVDFTHYKRNTLNRRVTRRMVLHRLDNLTAYVRKLQGDAAEVAALYNDILINVTSFFRDAAAYDALKAKVFPNLVDEHSRDEPVRVWALACSTGEEAYSIAMAYTEFAEAAGVRAPLQIFATDLNGTGIDKARAGIYPRGIAQDLPPERLRRFFTEIDGSYRIAKPIRDMCVFARQNALADPPFSHMGLVACRNMLIYLEPVLQQKLIPVLHYALQPSGYLWLGNSETIGSYRDLFELEDPQHKIYRRKPGPGRRLLVPTGVEPAREAAAPPAKAVRPRLRVEASDPQRDAERLLLARYAPPGVLVDKELNILQFRGDTGPYLAPAPGRPTMNLLKMLREGLLAPVRGAVRKAQRGESPVREEGLKVRSNGGYREVNVVVLPVGLPGAGDGTLMLLFEEPARQAEGRARHAEARARVEAAKTSPHPSGGEFLRLQDEVTELREYLQTVTEEHETTMEELQSANEEVQSANEELQSTNEELETSREEIQSSNEELATVNDELQRRNDDLQQANNDLLNLVGSAQMPIVILGPDLRIRRFTPTAEKILNLIPADVGRPLLDIRLRFTIPDLETLLLEVIESASARELEVQDRQGRWYLLRIRPYKTMENRLDGVVMVLVDVDTIKRAEQDLRDGDRRKNDFLAMLSHELRTPLASLRSAAEVVQAPDAGDAAHEQARSIMERQTRNMARMVDDLLDLARVSHGTITLRPAPMDLLAAVRHAVNATQHERAANAQKITLSLPARPVPVMADAVRLDQIFGNLLINASKFTPREGHIWVTVETLPPPDQAPPAARHGHATISVRDNGIGIQPEDLPKVFHTFRGVRAPPHARPGMGLGLTLAQALVGLHDGTIEARSEGPSRGSEFVVRLPLLGADAVLAEAEAPQEPQAAAAAPRRILVVDDNVDAARIMRVLLELDKHQVELAYDGHGALAAADTFKPEIVLLDLGLPGMDGYAIARELRQRADLKDAWIVAVTGFGREDDLRHTREAGFNHHLTKPVERRVLQQLLARYPAG